MELTIAQLKYYEEACKRFYNGSYKKNIGNLLEPQEKEKETND